MKASLIDTDSFVRTLVASSRSSEIPKAMDLYGWLVGGWDLDVVGYDDDDNVIQSTGEAHVGWVLEGRAVQDVFINPRRSDRGPGSPGFANWYGTTLRIYDPSMHAWRVNWFNPHDGFRAELIGRRRGEDTCRKENSPTEPTFAGPSATSRRIRITGGANASNRTARGIFKSSFAAREKLSSHVEISGEGSKGPIAERRLAMAGHS